MRDDQFTQLLRQIDEPVEPDAAFADRLFETLSRQTGRSTGVRPMLLLVAAVMLVAVLAVGAAVGSGLIKVPWFTVQVSPAPSGVAIGTESPKPSQTPTSQPSVTPSPLPKQLVIDGLARSTVNSLAVRDRPTTAGARLGTIDAGQPGYVVAGPVSADGYAWYELAGLGLPPNAGCEPPVVTTPFNCPSWLGWAAAGPAGGPAWLEAAALTCPASPMNLGALVSGQQGPLTPLERLACYRSTAITFRAWWPEIPSNAGLGGACGAPSPIPAWLACGAIMNYGLVISPSAGFEGPGLYVSVDPASGVTMPPRGQWLEVMAHLDDPAARDCAPWAGGEQDPVRSVLSCRGQLVVESVKPVAGPY